MQSKDGASVFVILGVFENRVSTIQEVCGRPKEDRKNKDPKEEDSRAAAGEGEEDGSDAKRPAKGSTHEEREDNRAQEEQGSTSEGLPTCRGCGAGDDTVRHINWEYKQVLEERMQDWVTIWRVATEGENEVCEESAATAAAEHRGSGRSREFAKELTPQEAYHQAVMDVVGPDSRKTA